MSHHPEAPGKVGLAEYQRLLGLLDQRRFEEAQMRARVLLEQPDLAPVVRAKTHNLLCWSFIEGMKWPAPEAVLQGEEAVELATRIKDAPLRLEAICNLAGALYQMGEFARARKQYETMRSELTQNPGLIPYGGIMALLGLAQVATVEQRYEEALDLLGTAAGLCDADARFLKAEVFRRRALLFIRMGRTEEAANDLAQVDEHAIASGPRSLWWKTHYRFTKARLELALGHWASVRPLVTNTIALARELGDQPVLAESLCLLALVEQAEGRREAGRRARSALTCAINSGRRDVVEDVRHRLRDLLAYS